jgi:segregation and condensation protein B
MTDAHDASRTLCGLDARAAQEALAAEFEGKEGATVEAASDPATEEFAALKRMAEALLFAAVEPLDEKTIADRLPAHADIPALLAALEADYAQRGVKLLRLAGKWRFATAPDLAHILEKERVEPRKLSRAALETLAIIAYHQPCTRADIEDVRGVQVAKGSLDQLLEIGWVKIKGRREAPGRPVLYATTDAFLEHFGLETVSDLPGLADLKAAGLLEARLPPGFSVPMPSDADEEGEADETEDEGKFAQDFLEAEDER